MKTISSRLLFGIVGLFIVYIFRNWFTNALLSAPDFSYLYAQRIGDFDWFPNLWSGVFGGGMGGTTQGSLNLDAYLHIGIRLLVLTLHIPWHWAYRILYYWPFLIVGTISSYLFARQYLKNTMLACVGVLVYMTNTYILMLAGGGQMGLMIAYAFVPLVFYSFVNRIKGLFVASSALLILFDLRFSFLLFSALFMYGLFVIPSKKWWETIRFFAIPVLVVAGVHSFWLLPSFFARSFGLPAGYGDPGWLAFLSWAEFSKTLALLHPNWPENIFGFTHFMRPEFLLIPILVYGSMILRDKKDVMNPAIRYFFILGLVGAFLAKGVKPPFGNVYEWMFVHIPLFNGFRDPTKFYLLIVLAYAVLFPYSCQLAMEWIKKSFKKYTQYIWVIPFIYVVFWGITLVPFIRGEVKGTFARTTVPAEYFDLEKVVSSQNTFSRILVVPWRHRFVFQSENHPIIDARDVFKSTEPKTIVDAFADPATEKHLKDLAVKYIVVPHDSTEEIFLTDRKYDAEKRNYAVRELDKLPYLTKYKDFVNLTVYEYSRPSDHFYTVLHNGDYQSYTSRRNNPAQYQLTISTLKRPLTVIFSESFDPSWQMWDGQKVISSEKTKEGLNSFLLTSTVTSDVTVYYSNEKYLHIGLWVSGVVLLLLLLFGYLRPFRAGAGRRVVFLAIFVLGLCTWIIWRMGAKENNVITHANLWKSSEWTHIADSQRDISRYISKYGGSQMSFMVTNTDTITFEVSSPNIEPDAQGIDIDIDGKIYTMTTPLQNARLTVPIDPVLQANTHSVTIQHFCASTLSVCEIGISKIIVSRDAKIFRPNSKLPKTLAVIGDSITSSFGKNNYSYLLADRLGMRLHNAGIFGSLVSNDPVWDSALDRYEADIIKFSPDVVVVFMGTNDLGHLVPLDTFRKNYSTMLADMKTKLPKSTIIVLGLLRRQDFPAGQIRMYSSVIEEVARSYEVAYIDPYFWLDVSDYQDIVHPSVASQPKLSEKLYGAMTVVLDANKSSR
ncbi:SGNH/GDSL hydrolase family protein [Candidatus Woesebacteria bacterium]|nr:SGNH/GDSL hydrolase family protein [Candidatus Woesebacteria bacterium]